MGEVLADPAAGSEQIVDRRADVGRPRPVLKPIRDHLAEVHDGVEGLVSPRIAAAELADRRVIGIGLIGRRKQVLPTLELVRIGAERLPDAGGGGGSGGCDVAKRARTSISRRSCGRATPNSSTSAPK